MFVYYCEVFFLSVVDFLLLHFPGSTFQGRLQLACRGSRRSSISPIFTCDYSAFPLFCSSLSYSSKTDYYCTVNSISGVRRLSSTLFSLHNLVIDVDCHSTLFSSSFPVLLSQLLARLRSSVFSVLLPFPTSIVSTGRGLQFWWSIEGISAKFSSFYLELLDFYIDCISSVLVDGLLEDFSMFTVDVAASKNLVGYFRLPCTFNTKAQQFISYEVCAGTYALMDLFETMKTSPFYSPPSSQKTSSLLYTPSFSYQTLAHSRVSAYTYLRERRNSDIGAEERNNYCFMVYNAYAPCYGHSQAFSLTKEFNSGFKVPLTDLELNTVVSSAKEIGGYQYTTKKIIEFLHITPSEAISSGLLDTSVPYLDKKSKAKLQTSTKKQQRNNEILSLYDEGISAQQVAKKLGLSLPTVTTVLTTNDRSHKKSRPEKILSLRKEGKSTAEIAKLCGCSIRTVQRNLTSSS